MGNHDEHDHQDHDHGHDHEHGHAGNPVIRWLQELFTPHAHGHQEAALDPNLATDRGVWALKISLAGLLVTAIFQVFIVVISGSVALLADTIHNFSDALTAIPLGLAFWLSRRPATRRYNYGYGRAEDLAGIFIVVTIAMSAVIAGWEAIDRLLHPADVEQVGWVIAA